MSTAYPAEPSKRPACPPCLQGGCGKSPGKEMNDMPAERRIPGQYELRIGGHLDSSWAGWFDGLALGHESDGTTTLYGPVADQAALHGLLAKVRDIGAVLIAVNPRGAPGTRDGTKPVSKDE